MRLARKDSLVDADPVTGQRSRPKSPPKLKARFQISIGSEVGVGPGKADLLEHIQRTGSLRAASEALDMSYMRAWQLVKTMNSCFREPLVETVRGGKQQGGSRLTPTGESVLRLYRQLEQETERATRSTWDQLQSLVRS